VPSDENTRWAVPDANALVWQVWDDELLIYNDGSGETHHLNFLAGEALRSLKAEAAKGGELTRRLAEQFEIAEDNALLQTIDRLIHELEELGLIAPST